MAKAKKKIKIVDKWKRKKWFTIIAPKAFNQMILGELPSANPETIVGKCITTNLMTLMGDVKRQNTKITFEVDAVRGEQAITHIKKFEILPTAVKRKIKRGRDRVDHSFVCLTKDNQKVRIKPLIITRDRTSGSRRAVLRNEIVKNVSALMRKLNYETFMNDVLSFKFQRALKSVLHKISPVRSADIRIAQLLSSDAPIFEEEIAQKEDTKPQKPATQPVAEPAAESGAKTAKEGSVVKASGTADTNSEVVEAKDAAQDTEDGEKATPKKPTPKPSGDTAKSADSAADAADDGDKSSADDSSESADSSESKSAE